MSRLEAIKEAVVRHLKHMALTNPSNTVRNLSHTYACVEAVCHVLVSHHTVGGSGDL